MADLINKNLTYDWAQTRLICKSRGLVFDETLAEWADQIARQTNFTQPQLDAVGSMWCHVVATSLNRANHGWLSRIKVAIYWLGLCKNPIK